MKYYTGIGRREIPEHIFNAMIGLATMLADRGWVLRSGRAEGADEAFQIGAQAVPSTAPEIYVPWDNFNKSLTHLNSKYNIVGHSVAASKIAMDIHPAWDKCSQGVKKMHTRNVFQILGQDLKTPSKFVLFWAQESPSGNITGGTATAVNLARSLGIPTINMYFTNWNEKLTEVLKNENEA